MKVKYNGQNHHAFHGGTILKPGLNEVPDHIGEHYADDIKAMVASGALSHVEDPQTEAVIQEVLDKTTDLDDGPKEQPKAKGKKSK